MLEVNHLSFSYASHPILRDVNLVLKNEEIGTLIGISGSGKTTLFKLLTGMISPLKGTISIAGQGTPVGYHHVAYMTQDDLLLPWRTVLDNLTLIAELGKKPIALETLRSEARILLQEIGLGGLEASYPEQLSGGMRQRVSLARALLLKRPLLLLDEPFGSLDIGLREHMYALLRRLQSQRGTTMLMVTHDFRDAMSLSDRIFLLDEGCIKHEWEISSSTRKDPHEMNRAFEAMKTSLTKKYLG
jgi:NitT/TauT family transport system ATP-binding protein